MITFNTFSRARFLVGALFISITSMFAQDLGDIPRDLIAISGWEDTQFDDSGNWKTIDVTTKGVRPNQNGDMAPAIQTMINGASGKTIFKFPAGTYKINSNIRSNKSDFQVIGVGKSTKFLFRGGDDAPNWNIAGGSGTRYNLQNDIKRGDNKITLTGSNGLSVGDYLFIAQANGERAWDLDDQIVKITAKNGNVLTLDMKMGLDFQKSKARVEKANFRKNIKFSNFYMERTSQPTNRVGQLTFAWVQNAEVSKIESKKVLISHLTFNNCRDVLVFQNNLYGNFCCDRQGGFQYGITLNRCTRVNAINNRLSDLRHHIALQFGSDHCVIAYNRTTVYNHYADYGQHNSKGCHNNLFEGNYGSELVDDDNKKAWGTPHTIWFRNHATKKIGSDYPDVQDHAIIGNELTIGTTGIRDGDGTNNFFIGANIVNIDKENGSGRTLWGDLPANANLPASLYLKSKPSWLSRWPYYGPKATTTVNTAPTGSFTASFPAMLEEGYDAFQIEVSATDPEGDDISLTLAIDGIDLRTESNPPYEWGHTSTNDATATELLGLSVGDHLFEVTITDSKGASTKISKVITVLEEGTSLYSPIHDAYVEGDDGKNDQVIRLEDGRRTSYLQFDVSDISSDEQIVEATLKLMVSDDNGGGTISIYNSSNVNWIETGINKNNAPASGALLGQKPGPFQTGNLYTFNLSNVIPTNGKITLVLVSDGTGADDVSFASKDSQSDLAKPTLLLKVDQVTSIENKITSSIIAFPNPSESGIFHLSQKTNWEILNLSGQVVKSGDGDRINLTDGEDGLYLLRIAGRTIKIIKL